MATVMIYGANGYTGELVAREAVRQGLRPILAGRSAEKLAPLATSLGLEVRAFDLQNQAGLTQQLHDVTILLNASGPFRRTALPLANACIESKTHYLDLAGEVPEFEALLACDAAAKARGVLLMPGVGFGVVPTDSLAVFLKQQLPSAHRLTLAFETIGGVSRGTAETVIEDLPRGGVTRIDGKLVRVAAGIHTRTIDFGHGPVLTLSNPWRGDLSSAYRSTDIPTIEVFTMIPSPLRELMRASRFIGPLLALPAIQGMLKGQAAGQGAGPDTGTRAAGRTAIWGEVVDRAGKRVAARLTGPEAYDFTALTAVMAIQHGLNSDAKPGYHTPAQVLGSEAVLNLPGVVRTLV
jgi:short subunit dehydrogenase-like uncharacterized protein